MTAIRHWRRFARCRGLATGVADPFFDPDREDDALAVCRLCPVQHPCLAYAIRTGQVYGVWGGKRPQELRRLISLDRRGRHTRNGRDLAQHFNAGKTRCKHGHPFTQANTYYTPEGHRRCRACLKAGRRAWIKRRRAAVRSEGGGQRA
jgi:WhiB family redox-sensing transcriptional regulator